MPLFTSGGLGLGLKKLVLFTSFTGMHEYRLSRHRRRRGGGGIRHLVCGASMLCTRIIMYTHTRSSNFGREQASILVDRTLLHSRLLETCHDRDPGNFNGIFTTTGWEFCGISCIGRAVCSPGTYSFFSVFISFPQETKHRRLLLSVSF